MKIQPIEADVAVIVGRFQVHELHPGHIELLNWATENYPVVMVVLGCSSIPQSTRNPLSWQARKIMISEQYPDAIITHLADCRSDEKWSASLDHLVKFHLRPKQKAVLIGSRDSFIKYYTGNFPTQEVFGEAEKIWSGTQVRKMLANKVLVSPDFRAGIIHQSLSYYDTVIPTVDFAIFEDSKYQNVYLVRKRTEELFRKKISFGYQNTGINTKQSPETISKK